MERANKVCTGPVSPVQQPDPKWIHDSLNGQTALCENTQYQTQARPGFITACSQKAF